MRLLEAELELVKKLPPPTDLITNAMNNSINTVEIIGHIQDMAYENQRLKEELTELKGNEIDVRKFYAVSVGVEIVAALHNVHPDTVRKYVSLGLIEKHPNSTDAKILMRASDSLLLDFRELKRQCQFRKNQLKHNKQ